MNDQHDHHDAATIIPDPEHVLRPQNILSNDIEAEKAKAHHLETMIIEAEAATENEHRMGLWQALKLYPKASAWSIIISFAVVMEGFDVILLGSFYAYPVFRDRFGVPGPDGTKQIPASWQAGLGNGCACGQIVGLMINGYLAERFGYRIVMCTSLVAMCGLFFLFFFAQNLQMILAGEILCGVPWGIFQTLTTSYASEVAPVALRGYLTTWVNACWGIGQLISLGVLRGLLSRTDEWGWRIPYALQWVWPIPLFIAALLAPESPWWLVRKGRFEDAKRSLRRLTSKGPENHGFDVDNTVSMMQHTIHRERELYAGTTYWDCFKGSNLRRTEIVCGAWACQQLCGSAFMSYYTYFFEQAGLPTESAFDLSMGGYAINTGGTIIAWMLMAYGIGRRTLYFYGLLCMGIALIIIGGVGEIHTIQAAWAAGVMLLVWSVAYQFSVGTVCFSLSTEISSRRLLLKTVALGRASYCVWGIIIGSLTPYMLNPTAWNWGSRTAFFWAGIDVLVVIWVFFRLPEPRGLTFAEIDQLFESKVSARKFQQAGIDLFGRDRQKVQEVKAAVGQKLQGEEKAQVEHVF